jgi:hypothetical protein
LGKTLRHRTDHLIADRSSETRINRFNAIDHEKGNREVQPFRNRVRDRLFGSRAAWKTGHRVGGKFRRQVVSGALNSGLQHVNLVLSVLPHPDAVIPDDNKTIRQLAPKAPDINRRGPGLKGFLDELKRLNPA